MLLFRKMHRCDSSFYSPMVAIITIKDYSFQQNAIIKLIPFNLTKKQRWTERDNSHKSHCICIHGHYALINAHNTIACVAISVPFLSNSICFGTKKAVAVTQLLLLIWLLTADPAQSKHTSKETSPRLSGSAVLSVSTRAWQALKIQQSLPRTLVAWQASCQPSLLRSKTHFPVTCVWVWACSSLLLHHIYIFTQKSQPYCLRKALIRREVIIILLLFSAQFWETSDGTSNDTNQTHPSLT